MLIIDSDLNLTALTRGLSKPLYAKGKEGVI